MTMGEVIGLYIFVLAAFIGFEVITKVPAQLHTPLMSGANAISGIILIGAIIVASNTTSTFGLILGVIGVFLAMINVVGGFAVTDRMLHMFKKKKEKPAKGGDA
ncbi:MAG: NAD(P) transhydrogenase subunit alpha [Planctomycetota bacterium]|nr:NAD(P) transhydrogenase subunit alpha [Planctomycetota bacterium]